MQAVATKLDLPEDLIGYFSLFLIRESVDGGVTCESHHRGNISYFIFSASSLLQPASLENVKNNHLLSELFETNALKQTPLLQADFIYFFAP